MRVPRIWKLAKAVGKNDLGQSLQASGWGWSESSDEEAQARADTAAKRVLNWLLHDCETEEPDRYGYDTRLPREEIIREFDGDCRAYVSRNSYGALILNTESLMFIDVDLPPPRRATAMGILQSLFGQKQVEPDPAADVLESIRMTAHHYDSLGFRVYRTHSGYRLMLTNEQILSDSDLAQRLLRDFNADPLYIRMCHNQQCFRARLTPKPWRCNVSMPRITYPFSSPDVESAYRRWEQEYNQGVRGYSTCHIVDTIGPETILDEFSELVELHDRLSMPNALAPLA